MGATGIIVIFLLLACSDYRVHAPPPEPVADPPAQDPDALFGEPPDWENCSPGWLGQYQNLEAAPLDAEEEPDPATVDWWEPSRRAFRRDDASLEFGDAWWPVDQGIAGDPAYFSVRWTGWLRVWEGGTVTVVVGATTDVFLYVNDVLALSLSNELEFEPQAHDLSLAAGQYPVDLRFAQRDAMASAFRFRLADEDATECYPDFSGD